eukprot:TRINITY_DN22573_c0_g1_i1.p1 TRINITY_DN22573_c0_g1~~TRINITY_DN22573_c0_g1_i1.p1  ORF type:complete len:124 (+),score=24.53 TRINITY_DN22573_c0_g1_i1:45-374(+)
MSDEPEEKHECVNCGAKYTDSENYNGACCYHTGAYGRCGLIKRGNGWTCCGREINEKGCHTGLHTMTVEPPPHRLLEDMEKIMKKNNSLRMGVTPKKATATEQQTQKIA